MPGGSHPVATHRAAAPLSGRFDREMFPAPSHVPPEPAAAAGRGVRRAIPPARDAPLPPLRVEPGTAATTRSVKFPVHSLLQASPAENASPQRRQPAPFPPPPDAVAPPPPHTQRSLEVVHCGKAWRKRRGVLPG